MTVPAIEPVVTYSGNGSATTFNFGFLINAESELSVQFTNSDGVQTDLVLNTDYSIHETGNSNGSYITFPLGTSTHSVLGTTEKITLSMVLPVNQEVPFGISTGLDFTVLERSFDYLTRIDQIQERKLERCVKVKEGSGVDPDNLIASIDDSVSIASGYASAAASSATSAASSANSATTSATSASTSAASVAALLSGNTAITLKGNTFNGVNQLVQTNASGQLPALDGSLLTNVNSVTNKQADRIYDGVDLSIKFATEIAGYASVWAWIKARTQAGNFDGIHVGDYIPFTLSAGTAGGIAVTQQSMKAQIAGIDTYYGFGDTPVAHHIDFVSKDVIDTPVQWQPNDNNNGTSVTSSPWLSSKVYAWLNGVNNYTTSSYGSAAHGLSASGAGILQLLPVALQSAIVTKRQLLEYRYSSSGLLTYDNNWAWGDMGNLWLPHEIEVYGCQIWSSCNYSNGTYAHGSMGGVHYPLFACQGGYHGRVKTNSSGGRAHWWLSAVYGGTSTDACVVDNNGGAGNANCSYSSVCVPVCFRIA